MHFTKSFFVFIFLFLTKLGSSQEILFIKNSIGASLILNEYNINVYNGDLKVEFEKGDTVWIEMQKEKRITKKKIVLNSTIGYQIIETSKGELRLRLRSNLVLNSPNVLRLDTLKPIINTQRVASSFMTSLEGQEFEFDKVNLLTEYLREEKVSNENLAVYLSSLSHDFSRWQIIEIILDENLMVLDFESVSPVFNSNAYQDKLKTKLATK